MDLIGVVLEAQGMFAELELTEGKGVWSWKNPTINNTPYCIRGFS